MLLKYMRLGAPLLVLALGVLMFLLLQATAPAPVQEPSRARPVAVHTHRVALSDERLWVQTQGEVRARTAIGLTAQVAGRVVEASPAYIEGGRFDPGMVLLRLEDTDYRLALREAEAAVAAAELSVQQAEADADVARKQLRNDPRPSDLALRKPQIVEAKARREAAVAALEQARADLQRTRISLPFGGRVLSTAVHLGEYVSSGMALGRVFATDRVQVRLPLNDQQLSALGLPIGYTGEGDAPEVLLSAEVAGARHRWRGELIGVDAAMEPTTRLIYATAEVVDPYGAGRSEAGMPLAVGLFVDAQIRGRAVRSVARIPAAGLRPGNQVYVIDDEGRLAIREVTVVQTHEDHAIVDHGLAAGEALVVSALRNPVVGMALSSISTADVEPGADS